MQLAYVFNVTWCWVTTSRGSDKPRRICTT